MELSFSLEHKYRFDEEVQVTLNSALYKAQDLALSRSVAVKKVIIVGDNTKEINDNLRKAVQEVKTMVQISELTAKIPNIYAYHYMPQERILYIIMQWISGETLEEKMKKGVAGYQFLFWMAELCEILDKMSTKRFQHKDIKPQNIMFNSSGELYLIDFNISVSKPSQKEGTVGYKAPEMDYDSKNPSRNSVDMFSIGVMLYEKFTGHIPVRGVDYDKYDQNESEWDFIKSPFDYNKDINSELSKLILKLMSYHPENRYSNYRELGRYMRNLAYKIKPNNTAKDKVKR